MGQQVPLARADGGRLEVDQDDLAAVGEQVLGVRVAVDWADRQSEVQVRELLGEGGYPVMKEIEVLGGDARGLGQA